ncbi:DNA polymerase III subunit delta' [Fodinicola acaciae]|uniref:DNA polymerase III subunit delta' n=1 Tax=Fodinicola acaciae TaxID=2681555 RepID=UPI0013CFB80E|nr:DNA polymerase III subunit delta' [Fodinicola acaciae]
MTTAVQEDVFSSLVGQPDASATLRRATVAAARLVSGEPVPPGEMTHAWLFTGPPGSGRSVAAKAFAAALQCERGFGCGECGGCRTTLHGTHADVRTVEPEGLSIGVTEVRSLVVQAAGAPNGGRWQVVLIADADRLTESASNALLKAVEEPPDRTVFLLCAPSAHPDDVAITIRSRCRLVPLRTPSAESVAEVLLRSGVDSATAAWAAAASQGHVGRARWLARDSNARDRRKEVLDVPRSLTNLGACFTAAEKFIAAAEAEADASLEGVADKETADLKQALGAGGTGKGAATAARGSAGALKELERRQKSRATRSRRDTLDRALVDLAAFYRDVLISRLGAEVPRVHPDIADLTTRAAAAWTPESVLRRLNAVLACREAIELNVKPRIAVEDMMIALWQG